MVKNRPCRLTLSRLVITRRLTWHFSAKLLPAGPRSTAISQPSWQKRFPTVSTNMLRKPTVSIIPPRFRRYRPSGTGWPTTASAVATISATYLCWHCGGAKYLPISAPIAQFFADCAAGTLPRVSFVEPRFLGEGQGISGDDHPFSDIRNGEAFLNLVYAAITLSPAWRNTVLVINFDEWGGFFEHVPPTAAPIPPADAAAGNKDGLRGFRVPCVVISPWSRRGYVATGTYDHTSVLSMIEWRWNLRPLTVRDASAQNLALALDFSTTNLSTPQYAVPVGPFGSACASGLGHCPHIFIGRELGGVKRGRHEAWLGCLIC